MPDRDANHSGLCCYRCGSSLESLSLPLARLDLCPNCDVELHVCRMCSHYAPGKPEACDEDDALEVRDKAKANFCDYFNPDPNAHDGIELRAENEARRTLANLFGNEGDAVPAESSPPTDAAMTEAERLFNKD